MAWPVVQLCVTARLTHAERNDVITTKDTKGTKRRNKRDCVSGLCIFALNVAPNGERTSQETPGEEEGGPLPVAVFSFVFFVSFVSFVVALSLSFRGRGDLLIRGAGHSAAMALTLLS